MYPRPDNQEPIMSIDPVIWLEDEWFTITVMITSNPGEATWEVVWPDKAMEQTIADHEARITALEGG